MRFYSVSASPIKRILFWFFAISVLYLYDPIEAKEPIGWRWSFVLHIVGYIICITCIQVLLQRAPSLWYRLVGMLIIGFAYLFYVVSYTYNVLPLVGLSPPSSVNDLVLHTAIVYYIIGYVTYFDAEQMLTILQLNATKEDKELHNNFLALQFDFHLSKNTLSTLLEYSYDVNSKMAVIIETYLEIVSTSLKLKPDQPISLLDEVTYCETYVKLLRLINSSNINIIIEKKGSFHHHIIYPRLLLPLVENAVKHGVKDRPSHPIQVLFKSGEDYVECCTRNVITDKKVASTGVGRNNLRFTLDRYYPSNYLYDEYVDKNIYYANLKIKFSRS